MSLEQPRTILGRDSICDIVLFSTDAESKKHLVISRKHAIVNAVVDALSHLGVTHVDIPITPEKVWRILKEKGVAE